MRVTSCPLMRMVPLVALSMVETQLSNVDLPEPEAPMMPTNSPRLTVKLTSLSARVTLPSAPYTFSRFATSSTGVAMCVVCIPSPFLRLVYGIYSRKKPSRLPSIWLTVALPLCKVGVANLGRGYFSYPLSTDDLFGVGTNISCRMGVAKIAPSQISYPTYRC